MADAYSLIGGLGGDYYTGSNPIIPTTNNIVIPADTYFDEETIVKGDTNLVSKNIKLGVSIFGISGSAVAVQNVGGIGTAYLYIDGGYSVYKITLIQR